MKITLYLPVQFASEALITVMSKTSSSTIKKQIETHLEKMVASGKGGKLTFENKREFDAWQYWTAPHRVNPRPAKKTAPKRATVKKPVAKKRGKK